MGGLGAPELLVVFVVVLLVFGPRKIPEVARGIGVAMRELRRLTVEFQRELNLAEALEERKTGKSPRPPGPPLGVPRTPAIDPNAPPGRSPATSTEAPPAAVAAPAAASPVDAPGPSPAPAGDPDPLPAPDDPAPDASAPDDPPDEARNRND